MVLINFRLVKIFRLVKFDRARESAFEAAEQLKSAG